MKTTVKTVVCVIAACSILAGCGRQDDPVPTAKAESTTKPQEPVTLTFYTRTVLDDFEKYINQYVAKKFPYVTLKLVEAQKGSMIEDLIASGQMPDIIWEGLTNIATLVELEVPLDMSALAQKNKFDLGKYDPKLIDSIKSYADKGQLYYLPYNVFVFSTHYNKDIFDKFGVPYPKDNMSWDELIDVARKLTRSEGGVQYRGMIGGALNRMQSQLSLPYVDPKTEKSVVNTDGWKRLFETSKAIYDIPGQEPVKSLGSRDDFLKTRNLAMLPDILQLQNTDMVAMEKEGLRWDVVTYPYFKEKPGVGVGVFSDGFVIPRGSKNADIAFQVVSYLSSDPGVQAEATKNGRITGLSDMSIRQQAFENNPAAKGKNLKNVLTPKFPDPVQVTRYDKSGNSIVARKLLENAQNKSDINTLLRAADEELTKSIEQMKAAKK